MRNRTSRLLMLAVSLLLATVGALVTQTPANAANLLVNPDFETGTLSPWSCAGGLGSVVSSPVRSGTKALAGAASASDTAQCSQSVTVRPSTAYTLTAWVRGNYVYLGVNGGGSTWTSSATAYTRLTVPFTTAANQTTAVIYLHGWYGQGAYYADDMSFDGPGASPSPTPT
ncbi:carbohydrate binding domain-containing protein, partial [Streptosporangium minutum]